MGCGSEHSYPAKAIPVSIEDICRKEYNLKVRARVAGKTAGALFYMDGQLNPQNPLTKDVNEKLGRVLQTVTRVALSTDLALDFCAVVLRDRKNGTELRLTRSIDDTRRAYAEALSMDETLNRMIFWFGRYTPGPLGTEEPFVLKDVTQGSFLADQIAQRLRASLSQTGKETKTQKETKKADTPAAQAPLLLVDGAFDESYGKKTFRFSLILLRSDNPRGMVLSVFKTAAELLKSYRFTAFDSIEIQDYLNRQKLQVDFQVLRDFQDKKITEKEILDRYLIQSQSVQEAFKLFGFAPTANSPDAQSTNSVLSQN